MIEVEWSETPCAQMGWEKADKLFFSELPSKIAKAKALCDSCPLKAKCLQIALNSEAEFGIFGGTTPQERKAL